MLDGTGRMALALCSTLFLALSTSSVLAQDTTGYDLALVDMRGRKTVLGTLPPSVFAPRVSPNGRNVAFDLTDPDAAVGSAPVGLYVADLTRLDERRVLPVVAAGLNMAPIWSSDGQRLVFLVSGAEKDTLYWRRADGSGDAELLIDGRAPEGMTADGRSLIYITRTGAHDYGLSMLDMSSKTSKPLIDRPGSDQHSSRLSPDGRWIAYASSETGRQEVWLEPLPQTGKRYRITQTGGRHPLWSPDGKHVYFDQGGQMFELELFLLSEVPKASDPKALPIQGFHQGDLRRQFDLTPDGKRFLMLFPRSATR